MFKIGCKIGSPPCSCVQNLSIFLPDFTPSPHYASPPSALPAHDATLKLTATASEVRVLNARTRKTRREQKTKGADGCSHHTYPGQPPGRERLVQLLSLVLSTGTLTAPLLHDPTRLDWTRLGSTHIRPRVEGVLQGKLVVHRDPPRPVVAGPGLGAAPEARGGRVLPQVEAVLAHERGDLDGSIDPSIDRSIG